MEAQLAATNRLIAMQETALVGQARVSANTGKSRGDGSQMDQARRWLTAHPDLAGLSQRKAAKAAGVGQATLQRAMAERKTEPVQVQLF
jgi:hypothetical protein